MRNLLITIPYEKAIINLNMKRCNMAGFAIIKGKVVVGIEISNKKEGSLVKVKYVTMPAMKLTQYYKLRL
ncbi:hypothetical protein [Candidatus Tisiphia endosymbiont of Nemotelus uliginosus]|uniref:hypothetical protein n=1 Tax=Candidatus Tisiphia endosymbiont of Nemotelus uliginosus TaxID=3077926 RepID=UPI0035C8B54A